VACNLPTMDLFPKQAFEEQATKVGGEGCSQNLWTARGIVASVKDSKPVTTLGLQSHQHRAVQATQLVSQPSAPRMCVGSGKAILLTLQKTGTLRWKVPPLARCSGMRL
jgi:ethanolamine utilization protein EutQ (cupin superfamily)